MKETILKRIEFENIDISKYNYHFIVFTIECTHIRPCTITEMPYFKTALNGVPLTFLYSDYPAFEVKYKYRKEGYREKIYSVTYNNYQNCSIAFRYKL